MKSCFCRNKQLTLFRLRGGGGGARSLGTINVFTCQLEVNKGQDLDIIIRTLSVAVYGEMKDYASPTRELIGSKDIT